ncbi:MAG: acetylxylan esterase [Armatimonadia bacterium]|nr:acetylxylan esterase [Armatimonadia bacterium]
MPRGVSAMKPVSERLSKPSVDDPGPPEPIEPILPEGEEATRETWEERIRPEIVQRWRNVLGEPSFGDFDRTAEVVDEFDAPWAHGTVYLQPTGPDQRQQVVLLEPTEAPQFPRPAAVVPYYHPDLMAGFDLEAREPIEERPLVQFGRHLAERGFVVACMEAYPYNTVPEPEEDVGFAWWKAATAKLLAENPGWTGIGKLTWDTSRAVDLLLEQPAIDVGRVLAIGHSLGGKMAFYSTAFDERITACIASDFGIAWTFTNWEQPWYFGEQVQAEHFALNGHHALALIAPRPFLVIAGEADRPASWQYVQEAQRVYRLYDARNAAGCFLHMTGHQPTEEAVETAYEWLAERFGLTDRQ